MHEHTHHPHVPHQQEGDQVTTLAVRDDQDYWDANQLAILSQAGIKQDVTRSELSSFLHLCQRTKLDPFARQIYLIGRWDSRAGRTVYTPQTGIDGYRVVAQRTCAALREALGYEDTLWCGDDGKWTDVWLASTPPAAAKVTVVRNGQRFPAVALWSEYQQTTKDGRPSGLWGKMPAAQLAKCAESLALRKAFPNDLAGVYTAEEMAQADNGHPTPTVVAPAVEAGSGVWADKTTGEILDAEEVPFPETGAGAQEPPYSDGPVTPPADRAPAPTGPSDRQLKMIGALFDKCGRDNRDDRLHATEKIVGRPVASATELSKSEASNLITVLKACSEDPEPVEALTRELQGVLA